MNTMTYKSYTARVEYDERDNIFVGRLPASCCYAYRPKLMVVH